MTDSTLHSALNLILSIDKVYSEMPYEVATSSLRDVLTVLVIFKNITIEKAISVAKKRKVISEDDLNRLKLIIEPDQAIEKCLEKTK